MGHMELSTIALRVAPRAKRKGCQMSQVKPVWLIAVENDDHVCILLEYELVSLSIMATSERLVDTTMDMDKSICWNEYVWLITVSGSGDDQR